MVQPSLEAFTRFLCSPLMILASFLKRWNITKLPYTPTKRFKLLLLNPFSEGNLWKHPFFLGLTVQVQLVKKTRKTWKIAELIGGFWPCHPLHEDLFTVYIISACWVLKQSNATWIITWFWAMNVILFHRKISSVLLFPMLIINSGHFDFWRLHTNLGDKVDKRIV